MMHIAERLVETVQAASQKWRLLASDVVSHRPAPDKCRIGDYDPMTLQLLVEDYLAHLNHHLVKIRERLGSR